MEKYRHVIDSIVGSQSGGKVGGVTGVTKHQTATTDLQKTIDELRRTNYRLQNEKAELQLELKQSQRLYRKFRKHNQLLLEKNKQLDGQLADLREKFRRECTVKTKIQNRLYSMQCTYSSRDVTVKDERLENKRNHQRQSSHHLESKDEMSKQSSKILGKPRNKKQHGRTNTLPARVEISGQTTNKQPVDVSINPQHLQQIKRLEAIIQKQKDLIDSYEQQLTTDRGQKMKPLYHQNFAAIGNKSHRQQ